MWTTKSPQGSLPGSLSQKEHLVLQINLNVPQIQTSLNYNHRHPVMSLGGHYGNALQAVASGTHAKMVHLLLDREVQMSIMMHWVVFMEIHCKLHY